MGQRDSECIRGGTAKISILSWAMVPYLLLLTHEVVLSSVFFFLRISLSFKVSTCDSLIQYMYIKLIIRSDEKLAKFVLSVWMQSHGMLGDELIQMLRLLGLRKKRLVSLMPLLEFITWSFLKEDNKVRWLWIVNK